MLMPMIAAFHLLTYRIARSVTRSSVKKGGETHLTGRRTFEARTFEALKFEARSFAVEAMTREARRRCAVIRPSDACLRRKE